MAIRNAAYPVTAASFQDKVDHVSPVVAEDVNALQDELVATHTFVGVAGDLPPAGTASSATIGVTPGGQDVLPHITSHIHMLNAWVKQLKDGAGATDPVASEALAKANAAQSTASAAQSVASNNTAKVTELEEHNNEVLIAAWKYTPVIYKLKVAFAGGMHIKAGARYTVAIVDLTTNYNPAKGSTAGSAELKFVPDVILGQYGIAGGWQKLRMEPYGTTTDSNGVAAFSVLIHFLEAKTIPAAGKTYKAFIQVSNSSIRGGFAGSGSPKNPSPKTNAWDTSHAAEKAEEQAEIAAELADLDTDGHVAYAVPGTFHNDDHGTINVAIT